MNNMEQNKEKDLQKDSILDNKYIIIKKIDEGGFAKIYLIKKKETEEEYAAKVLKKGKTPKIEICSFLKEIEILKILNILEKENKYIPHIYDTGKATVKDVQNNTDEKLYYVTDYYQNKTLLEYVLSTEKGFSEIHTKFIFSKILKGVKYCHDAGICHLDLHLKNILLNENFEPKIIDFGLSLQMKFSDKLGFFKRESYTGKERCPEHFGKKLFDGKAVDIFCLGIILLHLRTCLFGFHPDLSIKHNLYNLIKEKKYDIFWDILTKKFPYISKLSPEFKKLYTSMVAYDPIERPDIDEILKGPWMKEINDLNEEEYSKLEEEVLDMFSKLKESIDNKNKDTFNVNENKDKSNIKGSLNGNKGLKEITKFDKVFFNGSIAPKYIYHKGYNAKNYIIINGKLDNPAKFMNILLNKILNEYIEFCIVTPYKDKLKANIKFEKKEEDDDDDGEEENEENEESYTNNFELLRTEDCNICIKLFEYINGGYELHFIRRNGDIEDYYHYFNKIKEFIGKILEKI